MNILALSAKADSKIDLKALKKDIFTFLFSFPSALADSVEIFECFNLTAMVETPNFTKIRN